MRNMIFLVLLVSTITFFLTRTYFPRHELAEKQVIVKETKYDTVETVPKWLTDSIKKWKKVVYTTDTIKLVASQTIVDTQYVPVNAPPEDRPKIWPLLSYHGSALRGDTAIVNTFSVRNGNLGISKVLIPGILTAIDTDSNATPRFTFAPFPLQEKHGFWHDPKVFGMGFGVAVAIKLAVELVK